MKIRELQPSELPQLLTLYQHLHETDEPLPSDDIVTATWQTIQNHHAFRYFGGFVNDELASSCTITLIPNLTRSCRPYGLIENVVTHAEHRGQGYGRQLLQHVLHFAWQQDCYKVMLMTGRLNEGTFRFYESAGFSRHGKQAFIARPNKGAG